MFDESSRVRRLLRAAMPVTLPHQSAEREGAGVRAPRPAPLQHDAIS